MTRGSRGLDSRSAKLTVLVDEGPEGLVERIVALDDAAAWTAAGFRS